MVHWSGAGYWELFEAALAKGNIIHYDECAKIRYTYLNREAYVYFLRIRGDKFEIDKAAISSSEYPAPER